MRSTPLVLDPAPRALWNRLQRGGPMPPPAASGAPAVLDHWRRSCELGAPARAPEPEDLLGRGADLLERAERLDPVLACGRGVLERVAAVAAHRDHLLLMADAEGVIVHTEGGGAFADHARRVRLLEGARWAERERGTNAIGTALAVGGPVFVRGGAHYVGEYADLVCYAAPVRDPDGRTVGVLDVTSFHANEDPSLRAGVVAAARALEEVLRLAAWSRAGDAVNRAVARSLERMGCPVLLIEPTGEVTRANGAARAVFDGRAEGALECRLGLDFETAVAIARRESSPGGSDGAPARADEDAWSVAPGDGRRYRVRFEPIETDRRLVALLAFLEPEPTVVAPAPASTDHFRALFATDAATRAALGWAARVAPSDVPVMLLAETGAGKELVARGVHAAGRRARGPFVAVNCGAIEPSLLASELFGYAPGAFTGARREGHDGYLGAADGGTLFLDEVADMPLAMQAALLRVLETGEYQRVGEVGVRRSDVRVICATCADLDARVADGRFRRDLYFRLKGALVTLPPLRERDDLEGLSEHLLAELSRAQGRECAPRLDPGALAVLRRYAWPGNVRELRNTLEVALVLAGDGERVEPEHLPPGLAGADGVEAAPRPAVSAPPSRAQAEAEALRRALDDHGGNLSGAARQLGVARSTLYRMLDRHGLRPRAGARPVREPEPRPLRRDR